MNLFDLVLVGVTLIRLSPFTERVEPLLTLEQILREALQIQSDCFHQWQGRICLFDRKQPGRPDRGSLHGRLSVNIATYPGG